VSALRQTCHAQKMHYAVRTGNCMHLCVENRSLHTAHACLHSRQTFHAQKDAPCCAHMLLQIYVVTKFLHATHAYLHVGTATLHACRAHMQLQIFVVNKFLHATHISCK
jgi:hypothetical protein